MASFNLIDDPVFYAYFLDGTTHELSIKEIFKNSEKISSIGGDSPIQEFPITRLLVAIIYGALKEENQTRDQWLHLWRNELPLDKINEYLDKHWNRFDLLNTETPFYQILNAEYNKTSKPSNMALAVDMQKIAEKAGTARFHFSTTTLRGLSNLTFAEATRKLIELQNYRTASKQSPIVGDKRSKKHSYAQLGWLGNFTGILLVGKNFKETLLLNTPPYEEFNEVDPYQDEAVWEKPQHTANPTKVLGPMDEYGLAAGPQDIMTLQTARVTLHAQEDKITHSVIGIGDRIFKYDQHRVEPMATWRKIKRETGAEVFTPVKTGTPEVWRGLESIMALSEGKTQILASNLAFFRKVSRKINVDNVGIKTFEVVYGPQDAIIDEVITSSLALTPSLFNEENAVALERVILATNKAKNVAKIVAALQADILVTEGKERKPAKGVSVYEMANYVQEQFLETIGHEFKIWVHDVNENNFHEKYEEWLLILNSFAKNFEKDLTANPSPRSISGSKEGDKNFTIFHAKNKFTYKIREELKNE